MALLLLELIASSLTNNNYSIFRMHWDEQQPNNITLIALQGEVGVVYQAATNEMVWWN